MVNFDICVVGGGPVGLSAAIMAASKGFSVCIFEPKMGIIDKACGEGVMPSAISILKGIGVEIEQSHIFKGIRYLSKEDSAEGLFIHGNGLGIRRLELHRALQDRCSELNIRIFTQKAQQITQHQDYVQVEEIQAKFLLVADGLHSSIRKKLGLEAPSKRPKRIGIRQHFNIKPWTDFVEVYWGEYAECYITPVSEDQVGIAILAYADHAPKGSDKFNQLLSQFPYLQEKIQNAPTSSTIRGAGPFEQRLSSPQQARILLIGDASGYLDPITGEGIRLGLVCAQKAVELIQEDRWQNYSKEHWKIVRKYWYLTAGLLWLRQIPFLRKLMVPFLRRFPRIFGWIVSNLG